MKPAIRVFDLGKRYRLSNTGQRPGSRTFRESLADRASALLGGRRGTRGPAEEFWALRQIDLEIRPGEVVGVIGRNGAGKSTFLKILSRITRPTTGGVDLRGRVGSLLEVGTGFHPELTGRENIYLNGSLLGMRRHEIARHFDEIVAFAEVGKFLDTPVKRYSSGMYVRLAFSVAAHLETEVLIVDEVLAVGDAQFQKKCLGKMKGIASGGRTVLFVSHQMGSVQRLCSRVVLLEEGKVADDGDKDRVIARYLAAGPVATEPGRWIDVAGLERSGSGGARFVAARYSSRQAARANLPYQDGPLEVDLAVESDAARRVSSLGISIYDRYGTKLVNADTIAHGRVVPLRAGRNKVRFRIEEVHLNPGHYTLGLWMADGGHTLDHLPEAVQIEVVEASGRGYGQRITNDGLVTTRFDLIACGETDAAMPIVRDRARSAAEAHQEPAGCPVTNRA